MRGFWYLLLIASATWVMVDAFAYKKKWGEGPAKGHPVLWFIAVFALWLIAFPFYLYKRSKPPESAPPSLEEDR